MKKKISILVVVLVLVFGGAISSHAIGFSLGVKGGLGLSNIYNTSDNNDNIKPKLCGGLMIALDVHFLSFLTMEVNMGWRNRGYKYDVLGSTITHSTEYFDMDFLAKFYLTPRKPLGFYILIGGYVGGPMKNSTDALADPQVYSDPTDASDVGMIFGGGVNIGLGKFSLLLETYGVIGFKTAGSSRSSGDSSGKRYIQGYLMVGFLFDF